MLGHLRVRWPIAAAVFALLVVGGIAARVHWLRYVGFPREVARQIELSLLVTRADVDAWARGYEGQAALLARIAAESPAFAAAVPAPGVGIAARSESPLEPPPATAVYARRTSFARSFGAVLRAFADGRSGVEGCWVWDEQGVLLGGSGVGVPARPTAAVQSVRTARGVAVDFAAPVIVGGVRRGTLVIRALASDSAFPNLNTMARRTPAGRTSLVARFGDSVDVAATRRHGLTLARRRYASAELPPYLRSALSGRETKGVGASFSMPDAAYAAAPLPSLGWAVVREYDANAIRRNLVVPILVEESIFTALAALAAGVVFALVRGSRLRRAGALARVRADFVAGVSHELRTPLAQIRMFAELLRKDALLDPGESDRALRIIEKEAGRLSILVDNVLNFARLQRDGRPEVVRPADVAEEVRQVIDAFAPLAAERGVRIATDVPEGVRALVDAQALRQVLINLLENAVKYGPRGQTVTVGASVDGTRVRLWVDDEGPGIAVAERAVVFEAFRRGAVAERSDAPGSGLGLAVVRSLVEHHGGSVAAAAAPAGGARIAVELPRASAAAAELPATVAVSAERAPA